MPERHLFLQRINVNLVYLGAFLRPVNERYPGNVAINHENEVCLTENRILAWLVPLVSLIQGIIGRKVYAGRNRFEHSHGQSPAQANELLDSLQIPAEVGRHD